MSITSFDVGERAYIGLRPVTPGRPEHGWVLTLPDLRWGVVSDATVELTQSGGRWSAVIGYTIDGFRWTWHSHGAPDAVDPAWLFVGDAILVAIEIPAPMT